MGAFLDFADVLAGKLKAEILSEMSDFPSENATAPRHMWTNPSLIREEDTLGFAWLLGNTERAQFVNSRGKTAYGVKTRPRPPHKMSPSEREAYCYFQSYIVEFSEAFSRNELKSAFRQLAKRLHPDVGGSPAEFISLRRNYEILSSLVMK